jgi:gliding motility-associated-like protein
MRLFFSILTGILSIANSFATHIVGGDFYYKYKSGDNYEITMKLYVDCFNGNLEAIKSDENAYIFVFDANTNVLLNTLEITRKPPIRLFGVAYKCVNTPGNVCVDQYNYIFDINLPKRKGGYILSFQRCCRNNTIKNIVAPQSTGATYWVKIPDRDLVNQDNSPIFKKFPPIFICKGFPLVFDHSANDADGDSLSYELYQPYLGADRDDPKPNVPSNPPFRNVQWNWGYSTSYQMDAKNDLVIDEYTGELTVTPSELGQYVCGVKVKEWRKINEQWVLIGETLRDYQFNVVECDAVALAYFEPKIWCSDTVEFTDKSIGASRVSWDFGDPASGFDNNSSNLRNPTHVFSKGGDYNVKQTAWNTACNDEITLKVKIRIKKGFSLGKDIVYCNKFKQTLNVPWTDYTSILWSTSEKKSAITVDKPGQYWVIAKYGDCELRDTINIGYEPIYFTPPRDSLFCDKISVTLEYKDYSPKAKFMWFTLADTGSKVFTTKEGKHTVQIYNNYCSKYDTIHLGLARITPNLGPDLFICNNFTITLDAGIHQTGTTYKWQDSSRQQTLITSLPGRYWVKTQLMHCSKTDELLIENSKVNLDIGPDKHFCDSVRIYLDAGAPNEGTITSYLWNTGSTNQMVFINKPGIYSVTKTDNYGCKNNDSILLSMTLSPKIDIGKDTTICLRSPIAIYPDNNFAIYEWDNGLSEKVRYVEDAGTYFLKVTDSYGCHGFDSIVIKTDPNKRTNKIYFPNAFSPNGDGLNDYFPFEFPVEHRDYNMKIFNRWGEKLYDSDTNQNPWDGITKDENDQLDAYIWVSTYRGCDGIRRLDKGTITILR